MYVLGFILAISQQVIHQTYLFTWGGGSGECMCCIIWGGRNI